MVTTESVKDIKELRAVKSMGTDLSEFEGVRVPIYDTSIIEVQSQFSKTGKQKVLKIVTDVVTKITTQEGDVDVRASELFNLTLDKKENTLGWSDSPKAGLQRFLNKMKCKNPSELMGKLVTIRCREIEDPITKNKKTFLGFVKE